MAFRGWGRGGGGARGAVTAHIHHVVKWQCSMVTAAARRLATRAVLIAVQGAVLSAVLFVLIAVCAPCVPCVWSQVLL